MGCGRVLEERHLQQSAMLGAIEKQDNKTQERSAGWKACSYGVSVVAGSALLLKRFQVLPAAVSSERVPPKRYRESPHV